MNRKMNHEVLYQCRFCNYVLKPKEEDPKPSYCPNCAIHNHKGEMLPVDELIANEDGSVKDNV